MKKLLLFMFLFVVGNLYANSTRSTVSDDVNDCKIEIKELKKGDSSLDTRQLVHPSVEASLDCNNGELTFSFNENIGEIVITVTNYCGDIIATSICNSNLVSSVTIIVPTTAGSYNIEIVGTQYSGYGEYEL